VLTAGDTLTGRSRFALDVGEDTEAGATNANQCRLIGFVNRADNEIGAAGTDTANIACLVSFHESYWLTGAGA
jgi:hypothetical protein